MAKPLPVVEYLKLPEDGDPYLEGYKCASCSAVFLGERMVCSKCGARDQLAPTTLGTSGTLYSYSIVHRSFPGVDVPYISAIVDLDGGGTVKTNMINIDPDPDQLKFGMPVNVVFDDALGRKDQDGNSYISFSFNRQHRQHPPVPKTAAMSLDFHSKQSLAKLFSRLEDSP